MAKAHTLPVSTYHTKEHNGLNTLEQTSTLFSAQKLSLSPNILELLTLPCGLEELENDYRPCISEDLKIGFVISDHATQTEISEVGDLKQSTAMTRTLLEFTYSLCDDFAMYKNILKMQYEEKIQEYSSKLWLEITDRLEDIDKLYKQKEMKTRYSYQQQLSDALAILKMNYSKYVQVDEQCKVDLSAAKIDKLRTIIDEQADKIEYLTALLEEEKDMRDEKHVPDHMTLNISMDLGDPYNLDLVDQPKQAKLDDCAQ
ncbi:hypothetical protein E2320_001751 [Naja naja]|nr:hypothetical protein E2320_001751 [Naja naja]